MNELEVERALREQSKGGQNQHSYPVCLNSLRTLFQLATLGPNPKELWYVTTTSWPKELDIKAEEGNLFLLTTFQDHLLCSHDTTSLAIPPKIGHIQLFCTIQGKRLTCTNFRKWLSGTSKVSQVKIIPFADCCVAIIHQSSIILSYLWCVGLWKQWLSFY